MSALRNEVDPSDPTDHSAEAPMALTIIALGTLHALCCGLPFLLLSGVSLTTFFPASPLVGGTLSLLGLAGLVWYRKRSLGSCLQDSGRCRVPVDRGAVEAV